MFSSSAHVSASASSSSSDRQRTVFQERTHLDSGPWMIAPQLTPGWSVMWSALKQQTAPGHCNRRRTAIHSNQPTSCSTRRLAGAAVCDARPLDHSTTRHSQNSSKLSCKIFFLPCSQLAVCVSETRRPGHGRLAGRDGHSLCNAGKVSFELAIWYEKI